jgi:hypothetical protein
LTYKLLNEFAGLFRGKPYHHRDSSQGDRVATYLYEDLFDLGRSQKLIHAISTQSRVLNTANRLVGKKGRRGDATFGERVPHVPPLKVPGLAVAFGKVATIEIGAEVKILAKAMRKQLDRVCSDLEKQAAVFCRHGGNPICVGIVGVNWADSYTGYEGRRRYTTDGKKNKHPAQEAPSAERDLVDRVERTFDEFIVLRFRARNAKPFHFEWVDEAETANRYGAALVRISREYESRF